MKKFSIEVNGRAGQIRAELDMSLLHAIRNDLDLKGRRFDAGLASAALLSRDSIC